MTIDLKGGDYLRINMTVNLKEIKAGLCSFGCG
jgi:hypothetical protein